MVRPLKCASSHTAAERVLTDRRCDPGIANSPAPSTILELDADEAAAFWPVYKEYEADVKALGDERLAIISDYADNINTLTDEKARDLITRAIALEGKEHALKTRYLERFLAVLLAKVVARFFQVDGRINNLIDLEISSQIPLAY
jgi:hypothetical protein